VVSHCCMSARSGSVSGVSSAASLLLSIAAGAGRGRPVGGALRRGLRHVPGADRRAGHSASRRRAHKVARETATLDLLSSGRLIFGAGLGSARNNELEPFGEVTDPRERARLLDHGLDALARYWAGEFEPVPAQRPRPPVWVAGEWPNRRPVRRALRWDGLFTIGLPGPEALAELAGEIRDARPGGGPFDLITELPPDTDLGPWERAGLTWAVTFFFLGPNGAGKATTVQTLGTLSCTDLGLGNGRRNPADT
jgi:hypothetical protein